jgi:hypothetical protein
MTEDEKKSPGIEQEDRIDESAITSFHTMGYDHLTDNMVKIYKAYKRKKDRIQAGRLSAEGLAFVAILADLSDGILITKD